MLKGKKSELNEDYREIKLPSYASLRSHTQTRDASLSQRSKITIVVAFFLSRTFSPSLVRGKIREQFSREGNEYEFARTVENRSFLHASRFETDPNLPRFHATIALSSTVPFNTTRPLLFLFAHQKNRGAVFPVFHRNWIPLERANHSGFASQ